MILADTSIWIDHLRAGDAALAARLDRAEIVCHPFVVAEIALGSLRDRMPTLALLDALPMLPETAARDVRHMIEARGLHGRGIGYVDAALAAACVLVPGTRLWTRDRRLGAVAETIGVVADDCR